MPSINSLVIRRLESSDSVLIFEFLQAQPSKYLRFFYAFEANEGEIARILDAAGKDVYSGVFWQDTLIGLLMLRGWDAGYEIPSFGVLIDERYKGGAFMRLTLDTAKLTCRLAGAEKLMAKIHPDNISVKGAKRLGFYPIDIEESTGNIIYHMDL